MNELINRFDEHTKYLSSISPKRKSTETQSFQWLLKLVTTQLALTALLPLFVFGIYPRLTLDEAPAPSAVQRAENFRKAMADLRKYRANHMVHQAANMRNGPNHPHLECIPIGGKVRVRREGDNKKRTWTGPWTLINKNRETVTVDINGKHRNLRSTSVRKWFDTVEDPNGPDQHEKPDAHLEPTNDDLDSTQTKQPDTHLRRSQQKIRLRGQYQFINEYVAGERI